MKSKVLISLSGYAAPEGDLETLKNVVPNGQMTYFDGNPIEHSPNARRLNDQLNPPEKKDKPGVKRKVRRKHVKAFGTPASNQVGRHSLPRGEDMYYGLKPIEHNPVFKLAETMNPALSSTKIKIQLD